MTAESIVNLLLWSCFSKVPKQSLPFLWCNRLLICITPISLKSFQKHLFFHLKSPKSKYWRPICSKDFTRPPAGQLYEKCSDFKSIFATFSSVSQVIMDGHSYFYRHNVKKPIWNRKFELSCCSINLTIFFQKFQDVNMKS